MEKLEALEIVNIYEKRGAQGAQPDPIFGFIASIAGESPEKAKTVDILGESIEPFKNIVGNSNLESC